MRLQRPSWAVLLVLAAAILPLVPTLDNELVYDDQFLLVETPSLAAALCGDLFGENDRGEPATGYYRPLIGLTYWLEHLLYGDWTPGYHLDNLLLGAVVALLFYAVLRRVAEFAPLALPAALLFAAHPVHSESLALVTGRTDPLATALVLSAMLAALKGRMRAPLLLFSAALFAKESAVALAPALGLLPLLAPGASGPPARRAAALLLAGALVAAAAFFAVKIGLLGIVPPQDAWQGAGGAAERLLTFVASLPSYAALLLWPATLTIVRDTALVASAADPRLLLGLALLILLLVLACFGPRPVRCGIGLFLLTLLPASNVIPITYGFPEVPFPFFERYLFMPSLGAALAFSWCLGRLARRVAPHRAAALAAGLAVLLAAPLGARFWLRSTEYASEVTLFHAAARDAAAPGPMLVRLAETLWRRGQGEAAVAAYEAVLARDPRSLAAICGRATVWTGAAFHLRQTGESLRQAGNERDADQRCRDARALLDRARVSLEEELVRDPAEPGVLLGLGDVALVDDRPLDAAAFYLQAQRRGSCNPALGENWRRAAWQLRERAKELADQGVKNVRAANERLVEGVTALCGAWPPLQIPEPIRAIVLQMMCERADNLCLGGPLDAARAAFVEILELEPRMSRCYEGLGYIAKQQGRRGEAYQCFQRALELDPDAFIALQEMFTMLQEDGRTAEATIYFRRLERLFAEQAEREVRPGEPAGPRQER
ncbi:MAG: tetratricopeptide repeat protein [Planctomycetes bacterium]|nr:tetratricopeptide repeat protein [Planctomycetota bacterium]